MFLGFAIGNFEACVLDGRFSDDPDSNFCELISCDWWFVALDGGHIMKYICKQEAIKDRAARITRCTKK